MSNNPFVVPPTTGGRAYTDSINAAAMMARLGAAVMARLAAAFAPHQQATPNMSLHIGAGTLPFGDNAAKDIAIQSTAVLAAPKANPRKDVVYIDNTTGVVGVATGVEAATPVDPAIPPAKRRIACINLTPTMIRITDADFDDLRTLQATHDGDLRAAGNLSDVANAAKSLANLGGIGAATTDTLTNKTIDANGTGNALSNIDIGNAVAASRAEAEAGTDNAKLVTPLRVKQAVGALAGGGYLGERGAVGRSSDIIRVNAQTLNTDNTISSTDNASCAGPLAVARGVTLAVSGGATFIVL